MKTMTCAQMGGTCETKITGSTPDEMMMNGMKHLESAHPEMATQVKATPKDDPSMVEWNKKFMADFAAAK
jgi:predicted small metal-binding protein